MNIAMLAHSTNPRGGVVHAMNLCEAMTALGARAVLHAPDATGAGFFRAPNCGAIAFPVAPAPRDTHAMVEQRIADYVEWFRRPENRRFDVYHAHDGISGNALATLKREGLIPGFIRTVHHVDDFADPRLARLQERSIVEADALMVVSEAWRRRLEDDFGLTATVGGNGVDVARFNPVYKRSHRHALLDGAPFSLCGRRVGDEGSAPDWVAAATPLPAFGRLLSQGEKGLTGFGRDQADSVPPKPEETLEISLRRRLDLGDGPVLLSIGGVEARKNTIRILQAFKLITREKPDARLVIAGGASLLDHSGYAAAFRAELGDLAPVVVTGPIDDAEMPALYRLASVLVFASVKEGFGLCVLEALASGTPVVVSRIAPFVDYLGAGEASWCDPYDPASIAEAVEAALRENFRQRGPDIAARFDWRAVAARHLPVYETLAESVNA